MSAVGGKGAQGIEARRVVGLMEQVAEMAGEVERLKLEGKELYRVLAEHLGAQVERRVDGAAYFSARPGLYQELDRRLARQEYFGGRNEFFADRVETVEVVKHGRLPLSGLRYIARRRVVRRFALGEAFQYEICSSYPASLLRESKP